MAKQNESGSLRRITCFHCPHRISEYKEADISWLSLTTNTCIELNKQIPDTLLGKTLSDCPKKKHRKRSTNESSKLAHSKSI